MVEQVIEKWSSQVTTVTIGATKEEGGTRQSTVKVGGETTLPFLHAEGAVPNRPVIAMEVHDVPPRDWAEALDEVFASVYDDPAAWAKKCVDEVGVQLVCLKLAGTHPDNGNRSPDEAAETVRKVLEAVGVPLVILGSDDVEKDNTVMPVVAQAAKGERCLLGNATEDNYKTLTVSCLADGHNIITESPIDINIAKQVNILVSDMGMPLDRVVMHQSTAALGYGMEYVYSIMERGRIASLGGDKMLACPYICYVGHEAWRVKEAKAPESDMPGWGELGPRSITWEAATAAAMVHAGADILVMRHPKAIEVIDRLLDDLMAAD